MPWLPYPLVSGGHQALYNGIMAIYQNYDVSLAFCVDDEYEYLDGLKGFSKELPDIKLYPYYRCKRIAEGAKRRRKVRPWYSTLFHQVFNRKCLRKAEFDNVEFWKFCTLPPGQGWVGHLQDVIDSNSFDIIQVEMPWMLNVVLGLTHHAKIVYVHHELGFTRRALEVSDTPKDDYETWMWLRFADMVEISLLNKYDAVITLSDADTEKLCEAGVVKPVYSSMAIVNAELADKKSYTTSKRLTFVGPELHAPNYDGIQWFLKNCWDMLKAQDSAYSLDIIGNWSDNAQRAIKAKYQDVNFLGYVDCLSETLQDSVMIVPINIGSGIRIKILEAASRGIPFVSTTVGAEGIPVEDGVHCFIADEPDAFVQSILQLQNASLQQQFIRAANLMVYEKYSLNALRENRQNIYNKILCS